MDDSIKREDALNVLKRCKDRLQGNGLTYDIMLDMFQSIPSANRLKGKWIDANGNVVSLNKDGLTRYSAWCSVCGDWLTASDEYATRGWFCPNCGADMRGENNEQFDL